MKVTIIFFSPTGNTRKVAEAMAEAFQESGHVAHALSVTKTNGQAAAGADVIGVGTPCFSKQAPTPVKAFLRTMPPLR